MSYSIRSREQVFGPSPWRNKRSTAREETTTDACGAAAPAGGQAILRYSPGTMVMSFDAEFRYPAAHMAA